MGHARIQKNLSGEVLTRWFFLGHCISQRAVRASIEMQLDPRSPIASRGGSVPVFLWKPIATCDFPGGGGPDPLSPSGCVHVG